MRIVDGAVDFIKVASVDIGKLEDPDFADGYPVSEYLDHLRENDFDH